MGSSGLEPPTSRLSGVRSNHLSYEPMLLSSVCLSYLFPLPTKEVVEMNGIEPMTPCLQSRCSPSWATPPCLSCTSKIKQRFSRSLSISLTLDVKRTYFIPLLLHRKEVIQPHLPIRLPCYDFTPVAYPTFGHALLAVRLWTSGVTNSHGVTGGVYKARERIHRGMLIRDY